MAFLPFKIHFNLAVLSFFCCLPQLCGMNEFPLPGIDSLAGLSVFHFLPVEYVISIPEPIDRLINQPVVVKAGYDWLKGYASIDSLRLSEKNQSNSQGKYVQADVEGFVPDSLASLQLFSKMEGRPFIVKTIDNNGLSKIIGTIEQPVYFKVDYDTKTISQEKGYLFSFSGLLLQRSPVYVSSNTGDDEQLYNDVRVISYDSNGFPLVIEYYYNETYLFTINKSWNAAGVNTRQKVDGNKSFF